MMDEDDEPELDEDDEHYLNDVPCRTCGKGPHEACQRTIVTLTFVLCSGPCVTAFSEAAEEFRALLDAKRAALGIKDQ